MVDIDKTIDIAKLTPNTRVALRNDSYQLHKILPNKVDPLVSLMKVEKVPDSTYEMVGGLDKQIREIKEVKQSRQNFNDFYRNRLLNSRLNTQKFSKRLEFHNRREYYCMDLLELEKHC